jgi:ribosomal protein S18 acetylase RimI-like enzyme
MTTKNSKIEIIKPTIAHAEVLAKLGARTFAETFVGMEYYTQEIVDGYSAKVFTSDLIASELVDTKITYFLVKEDDRYGGYAKLRERPPADCIKDIHGIYLERIYFAKEFQRRGLGELLLEEIYLETKRRGYDKLWLSVWEYNKPAVAFYRKHGFSQAGDWLWEFESCGQKYADLDWIMLKNI